MKKTVVSFLILFILSACSQGENIDTKKEEENTHTHDDVIPNEIFISDIQNSVIKEEDIILSIKTYLDNHYELDSFRYSLQDMIYSAEQLPSEKDLEKLTEITKLTKENDENFSNYILNNSLPTDYQKESERIGQYITTYNEVFYEVDDIFNELMGGADNGKLLKADTESLSNKTDIVNEEEKGKIEEFLKQMNIKTKAFEYEDSTED